MTEPGNPLDREPFGPFGDVLGYGYLIAGVATLLHAYFPGIDSVLKFLQIR